MGRLRNSLTGVVVNVDDETASRLNSEWEPAGSGEQSEEKPKRAPRKSSKSE